MNNKCYPNNADIYFAVTPTRVSGFTDQMTQFIALYLLGTKLGFKYHHTELRSDRSTYNPLNRKPSTFSNIHRKTQIAIRIMQRKIPFLANKDAFNHLGFNQFFQNRSKPLKSWKIYRVNIDLSNEVISSNNINSLSDLKTYVMSLVDNKLCEPLMLILKVRKGRKVLDIIFSELQPDFIRKELNQNYWELRLKNNWTSRFDNKDIKILAHIRQGDTSVIRTPWNTYIPVFAWYPYVEGAFSELQDLSELKTHYNITVDEYYKFFVNAFNQSTGSNASILIFSDGFKRGFSRIYQNMQKFNFTDSQMKLLKESEKNYDKKAFKPFDDLSSAKLIIGEDSSKLLDLIHSVFDSDIIVIGSHQAMIPKLLSVYFDESDVPLVIVLYKERIPDYKFLSKEIIEKKFIFNDVNNPDYNKVASQLKHHLAIN